MTRRTRTIVVSICGFALVVAAIAFSLSRRAPHAAPPATSAAANVPLARAVFASYVTRVRASGRVGVPSGGEAKLAFASAGIVAKIDVHVGETVRAGEALAQLETSSLGIDVAQARSDALAAAAAYGGGTVPSRALSSADARLTVAREKLSAARNGTGSAQSDREAALAAVRQSDAKLDVDRSALERATALYAGGVVAEKDVEAARATLTVDRADAEANRAKAASARAGLEAALVQARADVAQADSDVRTARAQVTVTGAQAASAQARYEAAQRAFALGTLRAPLDGVVTAVLKHPGEAVDPAQAAIVVGPPSSNEATLTLSAEDARRVRPGAAVKMEAGGASAGGRVRAVVPSVDPATQTATVVVVGVPPGAASGDAVEATIDVAARRGIVIPTSAVVEDPQSGLSIVFVRERARDGTEKFVSREIGVASSDDRQTLVASGIRSGERVASQGAFDLLAPSGGG